MLMNWQTHGGRGPHLLLVHGFLCSAAQWECNLDGLREHCQPITVDLLGHGRSKAPEQAQPYHPDAYVARFEDIRSQLGVESWFVLGYSMGAGLTMRYAQQQPNRITGHLFTNSTSALSDAAGQAKMAEHGATQSARIRAEGRSAIEKLAVHPRRANHLDQGIKRTLLSEAELLDPTGIAQTLTVTIPALSMRESCQKIAPPGLLLWGTRERRFAPFAEYAIAAMPGLNVAQLDSGHGVNMEEPERFNQRVTEFIQQCRTS